MEKRMFLFAEKIKILREQHGITQSELARKLGLTRSSINGWEMGLAAPSTNVVVQLAQTFHVTTDYLLGLEKGMTIRVDDLTEKETAVLLNLIECFRDNKEK